LPQLLNVTNLLSRFLSSPLSSCPWSGTALLRQGRLISRATVIWGKSSARF